MDQDYQNLCEKITIKNKETMRKKIWENASVGRGRAFASRRVQPKRWKLIVANVTGAACLAAAALVLLLTVKQPPFIDTTDPTPSVEGTYAPAPFSAEEWLYYPAGELGLYRVSADGTQMVKMDYAIDGVKTENTLGHYAEEAIAHDGWLYYSLYYVVSGAETESQGGRAGLYRMRPDGTEQMEILGGDDNRKLASWQIEGDSIYWTDHGRLYKMRLDGSEKTELAVIDQSWADTDEIMIGQGSDTAIVLMGDWAYYMKLNDALVTEIWRTSTDGKTSELLCQLPDTEEDPDWIIYAYRYYSLRASGNWVYFWAESRNNNTDGWQGGLGLHRFNAEGEVQTVFDHIGAITLSGGGGWAVAKDSVYFRGRFASSADTLPANHLFQADLISGEITQVHESNTCRNIRLLGDAVYYTAFDEEEKGYFLCRIDPISNEPQKVGAFGFLTAEAPEQNPADNVNAGAESTDDDGVIALEDINMDQIEATALEFYEKKYGDTPMIMYYIDAVQANYDEDGNYIGELVDFWVIWGERQRLCISVCVSSVTGRYTVDREYLDSDASISIETLKTCAFPVMRIFD
ncbi:MAG: DUF5050 domain-containing protein [Clostridiales bacterium]|nr:DUF5050 domain-containing protein [Clostridiales bacterium]